MVTTRSAGCLRGFPRSPVSPFGIVAHPRAMDSLLVAYGGAALLITCFAGHRASPDQVRQSSRTRFVWSCSRSGVFGLSLSLVLAVKIRCTVWFYGALSLVSVFGLPIFITSRVLEALVCYLPLLLSVNVLQVSGENKLNEIVMNQLLRQCHEK